MKIIIFIMVLLLTACNQTDSLISKTDTIHSNNVFSYISTLEIPEKLDFCGEELPLNIPEVKERAEREFYILLQQPGQIVLYLKRSGRLFPMFEKIIEENDMPDDIKYLAVAESALYMARSPKGAVGLWQFIPSTAKLMGLKVNSYVDERRHPEKSTRAAMKYLKDGYAKHRSWILTAAGYNMGHTSVAQNLKYQDGDDYFDLFLNEETSRFIFRIAIIKELMKNHEKYGFNLDESDYYRPYKTKTIRVADRIPDIHEWAVENGTTYKWVKLLNPWILKRTLPTPSRNDPWEILVPDAEEGDLKDIWK